MNRKELWRILARADRGRVLFRYFKNRYALLLLGLAAETGRGVSELEAGPLAPLLRKPVVTDVLDAGSGGGLQPGLFKTFWRDDALCYRLTLGRWGGYDDPRSWYQTSRRGFNVVVQLNYSTEHDEEYARLIRPDGNDPFEMTCHPIQEGGRHTMAWARIDVDLDDGQALIEEIQNDWIRLACDDLEWARRAGHNGEALPRLRFRLRRTGCTPASLERYVRTVLAPHRRVWAEATLAAAIWFICEDLGIREIYFHTHETGCRLKRIRGCKPPVSLYEHLPRKFCFERTGASPRFIRRRRSRSSRHDRREHPPMFWRLRL